MLLKRTKAFLTARSTVLVLILLLTAVMAVAVVVPQAGPGRSGAAPDAAAPSTGPAIVQLLGLDHVFSTWWFVALSVVFVVTLVLSTVDQLKACRSRTFRLPPEGGEGRVPCASPRERIEEVLASEGYRRLAHGPGGVRYVKLWPGYWGSFLFHLGMTIAVLFALLYVSTEHRVVVRAVSGSAVAIAPGTHPERRGLLARPLALPAEVTLFGVEPAFWENDQLRDLASNLVFVDEQGEPRHVRVGVNDYQRYRGMIVYQRTAFGNAFHLEVKEGAERSFEMTLPLALPAGRDKASYGTFPLGETGRTLKAKYYANADRSRILPENPQLFLRLYDGEALLAEASLVSGQAARLGPYEVRLAAVAWWTDLLFEGSLGTAGIFTGFALLLCGGALTFFAVPREAVLRETAAGCTLAWRTTRFPDHYREEGDRILARARGGSAS